jgi:hypothetical protein
MIDGKREKEGGMRCSDKNVGHFQFMMDEQESLVLD